MLLNNFLAYYQLLRPPSTLGSRHLDYFGKHKKVTFSKHQILFTKIRKIFEKVTVKSSNACWKIFFRIFHANDTISHGHNKDHCKLTSNVRYKKNYTLEWIGLLYMFLESVVKVSANSNHMSFPLFSWQELLLWLKFIFTSVPSRIRVNRGFYWWEKLEVKHLTTHSLQPYLISLWVHTIRQHF